MNSVSSAIAAVKSYLQSKEKTNPSSDDHDSSKTKGSSDSKKTNGNEARPIEDEVEVTEVEAIKEKKDDENSDPGGDNTTVVLNFSKSPGSVTVQLDDKLSARLNSVLSRIDRVSAKFEVLLDKINEDYGSEQNAENLKQLQRYARIAQRLLGRLNGLDSDLGSDLGSKLSELFSRAGKSLTASQGFLTGSRQRSYRIGGGFEQSSGMGSLLNLSA